VNEEALAHWGLSRHEQKLQQKGNMAETRLHSQVSRYGGCGLLPVGLLTLTPICINLPVLHTHLSITNAIKSSQFNYQVTSLSKDKGDPLLALKAEREKV
jgi:hypothetical protein